MAKNVNELSKPKDKSDGAANSGELPTKEVVTKLKDTTRSIDQKISTLRGEKGAAIKVAADDKNVHKKAFKAAMTEFGMEPDERANYQRHLAKYRQDLGIELQGDIFKDDEVAKQPAARKSEPAASNLSGVGAAPAH